MRQELTKKASVGICLHYYPLCHQFCLKRTNVFLMQSFPTEESRIEQSRTIQYTGVSVQFQKNELKKVEQKNERKMVSRNLLLNARTCAFSLPSSERREIISLPQIRMTTKLFAYLTLRICLVDGRPDRGLNVEHDIDHRITTCSCNGVCWVSGTTRKGQVRAGRATLCWKTGHGQDVVTLPAPSQIIFQANNVKK